MRHGLSRLRALRPGLDRVGRSFVENFRHRAHALRAERVTGLARVLDRVDPLVLRLDVVRDAVAFFAGAGKLALLGNLQHRIPVHAGVILRGLFLTGCRHRFQVQFFSGPGGGFWGIHKPIASHPHAVFRFRQLGNQEAPLVVGHHDLGESGRQVRGLRDHPDARFRPPRAVDNSAEIGRADALRMDGRRETGGADATANQCDPHDLPPETFAGKSYAESERQDLKMSSGNSAETVTFGTSTTLLTRRSTATLHST